MIQNKIKFLMGEKKLLIGAAGLALILLPIVLFLLFAENQIIVKIDHQEVSTSFRGNKTVGEVLEAQNIRLCEADKVEPGLDAKLEDGDVVSVQIAKPVKITLDSCDGTKDQFKIVKTTDTNVESILEASGIQVSKLDKVEPSLSSAISEENNTIKVVQVEEKVEPKEVTLKYDSIEKENAKLPKGETKLVQRGSNGLKTIEEKVTYEGGKEVDRKVVSEEVTKPVVNEVKEIGTKVEKKVASSSTKTGLSVSRGEQSSKPVEKKAQSASKSNGSKTITVVATAYYAGNQTASGTKPQANRTIAASSNYAFGTKLYIPSLGQTYTVEDRGGAVNGNKIDIYFNSRQECINFGRRTLQAQVIQ